MTNLNQLPDDLPVPVDDGAASHLIGMGLPDLELQGTDGNLINLSKIDGYLVLYCYPMTGQPGVALPDGWDQIPGARGCTPQSCAFRDHYKELRALNADVLGISTQSTDYQKEMVSRLHLPFPVLSDCDFKFTDALKLPTFTAAGLSLIKRLTLISKNSVIKAVHYPVFPSDKDPEWVIDYLSKNQDARVD